VLPRHQRQKDLIVVFIRQQQADRGLHRLHLRDLDFGRLLRRGVGECGEQRADR